MAEKVPNYDGPADDLGEGTQNWLIKEECEDRLEEARRHKAEWEVDMREGYFFAAPHRARSLSSRTPNHAKPLDAGEANTSFACEMATDFATVIMNTFMPETAPWVARQPGLNVPDSVKQAVKDQIEAEDKKIFQGIAASNFYSECSMSFIPDMALGTVAMWIEDIRPYAGIECHAIPLHELEISTGPNGHLDFRAHVQHITYRKLKAFLPKVKVWPKEIEEACEKKPREQVEVRRCFWRDWSVLTDVVWNHTIMVGGHVVEVKMNIRGEGSCPLIVGRFNPIKEWAYAAGPLIQALPDLRCLDELAAKKIMNCDLSLIPPISIPDDSVVNFEEGIEAGMCYPVRVGSQDAIKNMYESTSPDVAIYDRSDIEQGIKRLHFLDYPDQMGKTPPSATQWLDQMTMAQRRIGTPGRVFWREWCAEIFIRYEYLLAKRGFVTAVKHDGKRVSLVPINPAQKSAESQEVAQASRVIEIGAQAFPEEWKVAVDGAATIKNLVEKGGAEDVIVFRQKDDMKTAAALIAQVQGGQAPGAPAAATNAGQPDLAPPPPAGPPPQAPTQTQIRGRM